MSRRRVGAPASPAGRGRAEDGSAVADFVLVSVLVCALVLAMLQLAFALHVRNTLTWAASEGARAGARLGATPQDGAQRSRDLITASLAAAYAGNVQAGRRMEGDVAIVEVQVTAPLPVLALWGPGDVLTTRGRAFAEAQP